eukprot:SAG25_NODE_346_length_9382_cov_25.918669_4_plen_66_part_00
MRRFKTTVLNRRTRYLPFPDRQRRSGPAKIEALLLDLGLLTGAGASLLFSSLPPKWALDRDNHDA